MVIFVWLNCPTAEVQRADGQDLQRQPALPRHFRHLLRGRQERGRQHLRPHSGTSGQRERPSQMPEDS